MKSQNLTSEMTKLRNEWKLHRRPRFLAAAAFALLLILGGCGGSGTEDHPFKLDYEMIPEEREFLQSVNNFAPAPVPSDLEDEVVELGWEACWQFSPHFTQAENEKNLEEVFRRVEWSPNADEWITIVMGAASTLCPEVWEQAVERYGG